MKKESGEVVTLTLSFLVIVVITVFFIIWFVIPIGLGQKIESSCKVNGLGQGSCSFTNTGWTPGTVCAEVTITNTSNHKIASSGTLCSGRVWPNDTAEKSFAIVMGDTCTDENPYLASPWNKNCEMHVLNR